MCALVQQYPASLDRTLDVPRNSRFVAVKQFANFYHCKALVEVEAEAIDRLDRAMTRGQGSVNVEVHLLGLVVVVREAAEYGQARVFVKHCGFCGCVLGCIVLNKVKMPFGPPIGTNAPLGMASLVYCLARALRCTGKGTRRVGRHDAAAVPLAVNEYPK